MYVARVMLPANTLHEVTLRTSPEVLTDGMVLEVASENPEAIKAWLRTMLDACAATLVNIEAGS